MSTVRHWTLLIELWPLTVDIHVNSQHWTLLTELWPLIVDIHVSSQTLNLTNWIVGPDCWHPRQQSDIEPYWLNCGPWLLTSMSTVRHWTLLTELWALIADIHGQSDSEPYWFNCSFWLLFTGYLPCSVACFAIVIDWLFTAVQMQTRLRSHRCLLATQMAWAWLSATTTLAGQRIPCLTASLFAADTGLFSVCIDAELTKLMWTLQVCLFGLGQKTPCPSVPPRDDADHKSFTQQPPDEANCRAFTQQGGPWGWVWTSFTPHPLKMLGVNIIHTTPLWWCWVWTSFTPHPFEDAGCEHHSHHTPLMMLGVNIIHTTPLWRCWVWTSFTPHPFDDAGCEHHSHHTPLMMLGVNIIHTLPLWWCWAWTSSTLHPFDDAGR